MNNNIHANVLLPNHKCSIICSTLRHTYHTTVYNFAYVLLVCLDLKAMSEWALSNPLPTHSSCLLENPLSHQWLQCSPPSMGTSGETTCQRGVEVSG